MNSTAWAIIFICCMVIQTANGIYIRSAIRRVRLRLERVHYTLMMIFLSMGVFLSITMNIASVMMLLLQDKLMNNKWLCKAIVIPHKVISMYGPTTVIGAYIWITLQFMFPLRARSWSNTSTIRRSFILMWSYVTLVYGLPAAVDPYVAQCQQSLMFPNRYHGHAIVYTVLLPYIIIFFIAHSIVYRKAKQFTVQHCRRETDLMQQQQINNLKNLKKTFTLICIMTCAKMICVVILINYVLFFDHQFGSDFMFHIFFTSFVNVHMVIVPWCICRNKKVWANVKVIIHKDFRVLLNFLRPNNEELTNTSFNTITLNVSSNVNTTEGCSANSI